MNPLQQAYVTALFVFLCTRQDDPLFDVARDFLDGLAGKLDLVQVEQARRQALENYRAIYGDAA